MAHRDGEQNVAISIGFVDVGSQDEDVPQWMEAGGAADAGAPNIDTLRPPRLAAEIGDTLELLRIDELSDSRPANGLSSWPNVFEVAEPATPANGDDSTLGDPGEEASPERRRKDTLIDELIPRADEEAASALKQALGEFAELRSRMLAQAELDLVQLVETICRRVLAREVSLDPRLVHGLVREGLTALGESDQVTVRLGPFFAEVAHEVSEHLSSSGVQAQVVVDDSKGLYGCTIETTLGEVDESLEARLGALLAASEDGLGDPV